jgi:hypothetical protein
MTSSPTLEFPWSSSGPWCVSTPGSIASVSTRCRSLDPGASVIRTAAYG